MTQSFDQRLCLLQVLCIKPLSKPTINLGQHLVSLLSFALLLPQAGQTCCCTEFERLCALPLGNVNSFEETGLWRRMGEWGNG